MAERVEGVRLRAELRNGRVGQMIAIRSLERLLFEKRNCRVMYQRTAARLCTSRQGQSAAAKQTCWPTPMSTTCEGEKQE